MKTWLPLPLACAALLAAAAPPAGGATYRDCDPIVNPYAGTRDEGADLTRIRALRITCASARKVVRGAHRKGLEVTPSTTGIRRYRWNGWSVTGDLRPASDRYIARKGTRRVRWAF